MPPKSKLWSEVEVTSEKDEHGNCEMERNWSSFGFIHDKKRNRLQASRARDLLFVFSNLRLLRKVVGEEYEELFPMWDSESESDAEDE